MSGSDFPAPPPTFEFLVFSLKMQAEMHLGLVGFGEDQEVHPNLPAARHAIDLMAMLNQKTRGNLSLEEQRLLENGLTELRFRYVQAMEKAKQAGAGAAPGETPGEAESEKPADSGGSETPS